MVHTAEMGGGHGVSRSGGGGAEEEGESEGEEEDGRGHGERGKAEVAEWYWETGGQRCVAYRQK